MTQHESQVGRVVRGFRFEKLLGKGGMGNVYLGRHETIGSRVAIKVLHPEFVSDADMERRFLDEARAVNKVEHPGLVKINDCGLEDGVGVFLVMELLDGRTLRDRLKQDGPLPPGEVVRVVGQVVSALEAVHRKGIIHRDLKPENIMLVSDPYVPGGERVKILDFGIAKLLEDGGRIGEATQTGHVFGSPRYMSPEQCADTKSADHRTDIYAMGIIAYELVCGSPPFAAESIYELVRKHLTEEPALPTSRLHQVPEAMGCAILKALAQEPEQRYQNVAAFGAALEASLEGQPASETLQWGAAAGPGEDTGTDVNDHTPREEDEGLGSAPTMLAGESESVGVITTDPPVKLKQTEQQQAITRDGKGRGIILVDRPDAGSTDMHSSDTEMASPGVDSDSSTQQALQETLPVIGEVATEDAPPRADDEGGEAMEEPAALPWYRRAAIPAGVALAGLLGVALVLSMGGGREDLLKPGGRGAAMKSTETSNDPGPPSPAAGGAVMPARHGTAPVGTAEEKRPREVAPAATPDAGQPPAPVIRGARRKARPGKERKREGRRPAGRPAVVVKPAPRDEPKPAPEDKTRPTATTVSPSVGRPGTDLRYRKLSPRPAKPIEKDHHSGGLKKGLRYRRIKGSSSRKE